MFTLRNCFPALMGLIILVTQGCESNHFFQSEKTLNSNIQRTWKMELYYADSLQYVETWNFNDGALTILSTVRIKPANYSDHYVDKNSHDGLDTISLSSGTYSINADIDQAYLKISGLVNTDPEYNKKWTIVQLDGSILDIAGNYNSSGGLMEREFTKFE